MKIFIFIKSQKDFHKYTFNEKHSDRKACAWCPRQAVTLPPDELRAGLSRRDHSGGNTSEEHPKILDRVCSLFKLHTHASIDNGNGIFPTLGEAES